MLSIKKLWIWRLKYHRHVFADICSIHRAFEALISNYGFAWNFAKSKYVQDKIALKCHRHPQPLRPEAIGSNALRTCFSYKFLSVTLLIFNILANDKMTND